MNKVMIQTFFLRPASFYFEIELSDCGQKSRMRDFLYASYFEQLSHLLYQHHSDTEASDTKTGNKILCKTSYLSWEIVWASRFSQRAVLCRREKVNIGSYGMEDMDRVRKDEVSAES